MAAVGTSFWPVSWRTLRAPWPWVILVVGLSVTLLRWQGLVRNDQARLGLLKTVEMNSLADRLDQRMEALTFVLRGAARYMEKAPRPTRSEWRDYVEGLGLFKSHHYAQGLSFVPWIPRSELPAHIRRMQSEGFPEYKIVPGGSLPADPAGLSSIIYLEPMDERNQRAFGRDMWADPIRREAMSQARDTGNVVLSRSLTLYQENDVMPQMGLVLFAPVYQARAPRETVACRRKALVGWVSIPIRIQAFMGSLLSAEAGRMAIFLWEGRQAEAGLLLFDSDTFRVLGAGGQPHQRALEVAGRLWTIQVQQNPSLLPTHETRFRRQTLMGGILLSGLAFLLAITLTGSEQRARRLADVRAEEILVNEAQFRAFFEKAPFGMAIVDSNSGRFLSVNPRLGEILGYPSEDLLARDFQSFTHPEHLAQDLASVRELATGAVEVVQKEKRYVHRDGREIWASLSMARLPSGPETPPRHLSIIEDITAVRQQGEHIRASEARFRALFNLLPLGVTVTNDQGHILASNPTSEGLLGIPSDDLARRNFKGPYWDIIRPDGSSMPPEEHASVRALQEQRRIEDVEMGMRRPDGSVAWLLATAEPIQLDGIGVLTLYQDLTERWLAKDALRASESRLRILADHLLESFLFQLVASPGEAPRFIYLSAGVERLCGVKVASALQNPDLLFGQMDPAMVPAYLEAEAVSARDLAPFAMEFRNRRADGEWRWFRVRSAPRRQPDGVMVWEGLATDITELKHDQLLLAETEARFRNLADTAPVLIWMTGPDMRRIQFNKGWTDWTGLAFQQAQGDGWLEFVHPEDRARCLSVFERGFASQAAFTTEFRLRHHSGAYRWILDRGTPRFDTEGTFLGYIGAGLDVQDLKDAEAAIRDGELRARKAESMVLMAGSIAHDFNNLFQGVLGYLEVAGMKSGGNAAILDPLDRAEEALRKAISLSWKMLDFSGRGLINVQLLDLETWLPSFLATLQLDQPPAFHLDVICESVPGIQGDRSKLEQVVSAIVDNAREAVGSQGGRLRFRLHADFGEDHPGPESPGVWSLPRPAFAATVCLDISDDGPGVSPESLNLLCDPFFTTKELGRGLGLAAAAGILRAHRAGLHIFNQEGKGLSLRIHFPPSGA